MGSEELRSYLKENKIRQYQFAKSIGICRTSFMRYLSGERPFPKPIKLAINFLTNGQVVLDD